MSIAIGDAHVELATVARDVLASQKARQAARTSLDPADADVIVVPTDADGVTIEPSVSFDPTRRSARMTTLGNERVSIAADVGRRLLGDGAALMDADGATVGWAQLMARSLSIAGGTSEITRNQIGERILGLPRDPLVR